MAAAVVNLTWTQAEEADAMLGGYIVMRSISDADFEQVADLPIVRDEFAGIVSEPLSYEDAPALGPTDTVRYQVLAYDVRRRSNGSNIIEPEIVTPPPPQGGPSAPVLSSEQVPINLVIDAGDLGSGVGYNQGGVGEIISGDFLDQAMVRLADVDDGDGTRFEIILVGSHSQFLFDKLYIQELDRTFLTVGADFADLDGQVRWRWIDNLSGMEVGERYTFLIDEGYVSDGLFIAFTPGTNNTQPPVYYGALGSSNFDDYDGPYVSASIIDLAFSILTSSVAVITRNSTEFIVEFNQPSDYFDTIIFVDREGVFRKFVAANATVTTDVIDGTTIWTWPVDAAMFDSVGESSRYYNLRFAHLAGGNSVQLDWTASTPGDAPIDFYEVARADNGSETFNAIGQVPVGDPRQYIDGPLVSGDYQYVVYGHGTDGNYSEPSNIVSESIDNPTFIIFAVEFLYAGVSPYIGYNNQHGVTDPYASGSWGGIDDALAWEGFAVESLVYAPGNDQGMYFELDGFESLPPADAFYSISWLDDNNVRRTLLAEDAVMVVLDGTHRAWTWQNGTGTWPFPLDAGFTDGNQYGITLT